MIRTSSARHTRLARAAVLGVVALVSVGTATGCAGGARSSSTSSSSAPSVAGRSGDVAFAQDMIPHHRQAVEMAAMALAPTARASAQVRALATRIRSEQSPEIATMTHWLTSWHAAVPSQGAMAGMGASGPDGMPGMMTGAQMKQLGRAGGPAFDRQWLTMMTAHHQGALTMARAVLRTTHDPSVRTFADGVVRAQQAEINRMRSILRGTPT